MTIDPNDSRHIIADEGKIFRRKIDGFEYGEEIWLGLTINGEKQNEPIEEKAEPIDHANDEEIFSSEPVEEKADLSEFIKDEEPEEEPVEEPKEDPTEEIKEEPEEEEIPYYKDPNSNIKKVKTDTNFNDDDDNLFEDWRDK